MASVETADSNNDDDEWLLRCTNCLKMFDDKDHHPRLLPCLHTLCFVCLKELIEQRSITCPTCFEKHKNSGDDFARFPRDNTRDGLLRYARVANSPKVSCSMCDDDKAEAHCYECGDFLCGPCKEAHKRTRYTKNHELREIDNLLEEKKPDYFKLREICENPEHKSSPLEYYCKTQSCRKLICQLCYQIDHRRHNVKSLEEIAKKQKNTFQMKLHPVQNKKDAVIRTQQVISSAIESIINAESSVSCEIDSAFNECHRFLQLRQDKIKRDLKTACQQKLAILRSQLANLQSHEGSIKHSCEFAEKLLSRSEALAALEINKTVRGRLEKLADYHVDRLTDETVFVEFKSTGMGKQFKKLTEDMGQISVSKISSRHCVTHCVCV